MDILTCRALCAVAFRSRVSDERGASLVEYTLLLALIALICVAAITAIGQSTNDALSETGSHLR